MKRAIVVLLLLIANAIFGASKEATIPDTAPGRLLQEWLTAFNAADEAALRKFAEARYTESARGGRSVGSIVEGQLESRRANGGFDVVEVLVPSTYPEGPALDTSAATTLTVVLKSRGTFPRFLQLSLKVDASAPDVLTERRVTAISPPSDSGERRKAAAELAKELDRKFEDLTKQDRFSGTALIAKDGKPVWQKAYGLQDRDGAVPVNLETRFRLGSMPKMFTSVAIAQLVEAGKLKFSDTLASVLPEYPDATAAGKIKIEHLLTHTSGLGDIFSPAFFANKDRIREHKDYLPLIASEPLQFEPGARLSYSNSGFVVLGLVIEKISGQSYYDYLQQHVFAPAGMKQTGSTPIDQPSENLAVGYTVQRRGDIARNTPSLPWRGMAAGGGESTVGDLLRFANALRGYKLLSRETTELITAGKVSDPPGSPSKYGFGFSDYRSGDRRVVGHNGGAPGMNGDLSILWDEGYTVVVLANVDPPIAQEAARFAADRLL